MVPVASAVQLDAGGAVTVNLIAPGWEVLLVSAVPQLLPRAAVYGIGVPPLGLTLRLMSCATVPPLESITPTVNVHTLPG